MRMDDVSVPKVRGKPFQQAINALHEHCNESAAHAIRMKNEIEDLKKKVAELQDNQR